MSEEKETYSADGGPILADVRIEEILEALAVPGLGRVSARRLLERFGSVEQARRADERTLLELGLKRSAVRALRERKLNYDPAEELEKCQSSDVRILPINAESYPAALRNLHDAPLALYVKGQYLERDVVAVGVVGARRASIYGLLQADRLAGDLARAGFTVVSGLARGIDAAAHEAALKVGGRTVTVLGNGLSAIYPREHADLAERIAENGALISELPIDTVPTASNFPPRNRLIAALSLGVLVVEASARSGALITARLAAEMGKEVFAVPGDIGRPQVRGTHRLIRDGAKLVESISDIVEELGPLPAPIRVSEDSPVVQDPRVLTLNARERYVYETLATSPKDIDQIIRETGMSPANVAGTLTVLEMKRLALQRPGKLYARAGGFQR